MKPSLWHRLDGLARKLTPFGLTLLLVILGLLPLHVPGFVSVAPILPVMAVYHWAIHRPELMPAYAVFGIGLLQDLLTGQPMGVNALVLLAVYGVVYSQRRFFVGKSFFVSWLGFALVSAGAAMLSWILVSAYQVSPAAPGAVTFQYFLTASCYPLLAWLFLRWQQVFLRVP